MTLRTRRYIFWTFLVLFILIGTGAIFYSAGWRLNAEKCQAESFPKCLEIQRTGAIFVETKQKGVTIIVDEEIYEDKSGIIQSGTLIGGLLPKNYYVEIEKDGYEIWQKNVEVLPQMVNKLLSVILVPKKITAQNSPITERMDDFYPGNDDKIVFLSSGQLYYRDPGIPAVKLRGNTLVSWSYDKKSFVTRDSNNEIYYLYQASDPSKVLNVTASFNNLKKNSYIKEISFHPADSDKIVVRTSNSLDIFDFTRLKIETINKGTVISWTINNPNAYYLKKMENLESATATPAYGIFSFNLVLKNESLIYRFPEKNEVNAKSNLEISADKKTIFMTDSEKIIAIDLQNGNSEKAPIPVKSLSFSPDGQKAAIIGLDGKIYVYLLEDSIEELKKIKGEIFELNFCRENSLSLKNAAWHKNSRHMIVECSSGSAGANIYMTETDYRLPINAYKLVKGKEMEYDAQQNKVYFIQENKLKFIDLEAF